MIGLKNVREWELIVYYNTQSNGKIPHDLFAQHLYTQRRIFTHITQTLTKNIQSINIKLHIYTYSEYYLINIIP